MAVKRIAFPNAPSGSVGALQRAQLGILYPFPVGSGGGLVVVVTGVRASGSCGIAWVQSYIIAPSLTPAGGATVSSWVVVP